jgi:hypothetical protein
MLVGDICTPEEEVLSCVEGLALASRSGIFERHCLGTPTCQASCIYSHVNLRIALLRLLCQEKYRLVSDEPPVDRSGDVPLQASHGVSLALAGLTFPLEVCTGTRIVTDLSECDGVYGSVQPAVATTVQSPSIGLA